MALVQEMRDQLKIAMKARDATRLQVLRYWIAQLTLGDGTEIADDQAIKKMRGVVKEAKAGPTSFSPEEVKIIEEFLPANLSQEQILETLTPIADQIRNAPKEGMAIGLAMKQFAGQPVDSDEVRAVVTALRG